MDRDDAILMAYVVAKAAAIQGGDFSERFQTALRTKGFVVVPVEATEAMHDAARDWSLKKYGNAIGHDASKGCWVAMLASAAGENHG